MHLFSLILKQKKKFLRFPNKAPLWTFLPPGNAMHSFRRPRSGALVEKFPLHMCRSAQPARDSCPATISALGLERHKSEPTKRMRELSKLRRKPSYTRSFFNCIQSAPDGIEWAPQNKVKRPQGYY